MIFYNLKYITFVVQVNYNYSKGLTAIQITQVAEISSLFTVMANSKILVQSTKVIIKSSFSTCDFVKTLFYACQLYAIRRFITFYI